MPSRRLTAFQLKMPPLPTYSQKARRTHHPTQQPPTVVLRTAYDAAPQQVRLRRDVRLRPEMVHRRPHRQLPSQTVAQRDVNSYAEVVRTSARGRICNVAHRRRTAHRRKHAALHAHRPRRTLTGRAASFTISLSPGARRSSSRRARANASAARGCRYARRRLS